VGGGRIQEGKEKSTPACPSHLHCIQTLYARFGRSVLKTDITDAQTGQKKQYTSTFRNFVANLPVSTILV
jgi:hypothetical protein